MYIHAYKSFCQEKSKKNGINTLLSHSCSLSQVFSFMSKKWRVGKLTAPRSSQGQLLLPVKLRKNKNCFIEIFEQVNLGLKFKEYNLFRSDLGYVQTREDFFRIY